MTFSKNYSFHVGFLECSPLQDDDGDDEDEEALAPLQEHLSTENGEAAERGQDDDDDDDDGCTETDPVVMKIAREMHTLSAAVSPETPYCGKQYVRMVLEALSQASCHCQRQLFQDTVHFVAALRSAHSITPILLAHHVQYDETPLKLRVVGPASLSSQSAADPIISKVFVIESSWAMLLAFPQNFTDEDAVSVEESVHGVVDDCDDAYLLLQGRISPTLRCGVSGTGPNIAAVLESAWKPESCNFDLGHLFQRLVWVSEGDELGANGAAERLVQQRRAGDWLHCRFLCAAHKVHSSAQKAFSLMPDCTKGISRCLLTFQDAGMLDRFKLRLKDLVQAKLKKVVVQPLTPEAKAWRDQLCHWFQPASGSRKGKIVLQVVSGLLNGDWRRPEMIHMCGGPHCCLDMQACVEKVYTWLIRLMMCVRPRILNRGNWEKWHSSLPFLGLFCGIHSILPQLYARVCNAPGDRDPDPGHDVDHAGLQEDADWFAQMRKEAAENKKIAATFLSSSPLDSLVLLRVSLDPEIELMSSLLHLCGQQTDSQQLGKQLREGFRTFPVLELARGTLFQKFLQKTFSQMRTTTPWMCMSAHEAEANRVFRLCMRPAAVVRMLLATTWSNYPAKLFLLLDSDAGVKERVKREVLELARTSPCRLDDVTATVVSWFPDMEGRELAEILSTLALQIHTTIASTESLHSRHSRRSRGRIQTHTMHLAGLGVMHCATTEPSWLQMVKRDLVRSKKNPVPERVPGEEALTHISQSNATQLLSSSTTLPFTQ